MNYDIIKSFNKYRNIYKSKMTYFGDIMKLASIIKGYCHNLRKVISIFLARNIIYSTNLLVLNHLKV